MRTRDHSSRTTMSSFRRATRGVTTVAVAVAMCLALSADVASAAVNGESASATCNPRNHTIQVAAYAAGDFNGQWIISRTVVAFPGGAWQIVGNGQWTESQMNPSTVTNGAEFGTGGITITGGDYYQELFTQQVGTSGGYRAVGVQYESWNGRSWVDPNIILASYYQVPTSNVYVVSGMSSGSCLT